MTLRCHIITRTSPVFTREIIGQIIRNFGMKQSSPICVTFYISKLLFVLFLQIKHYLFIAKINRQPVDTNNKDMAADRTFILRCH